MNIDYLYYDRDGNIQKIKHTSGVDPVNNALVEAGGYRMVVSHSNLALEEIDGKVVQQTADEKNESQLWILARAEKSRHYTLQNFKTKKFYCPPKTLLDTVKTADKSCEIRIENASKEKGYYLFADYDSDYLADVLDISKDAGMPLITWVRTGTDNQKIKLVKTELPKVETPTGFSLARGEAGKVRFASYDGAARVIHLAASTNWTLFDVNGVVVRRGYGQEINAKAMRPGVYFVRSRNLNSKVVIW